MQDLTKFETGKETSFNEPFNLHTSVDEAVNLYKNEALRRDLTFEIDLGDSPKWVVGDAKKIRTVVANLTANAGESFHHVDSLIISCLTRVY